jgi:hypothetical protein
MHRRLKDEFNGSVKYESVVLALERICNKIRIQTIEKQKKKLWNMYRHSIYLKQNRDSIVNLSNIEIDADTKNILSLGLNCHLKNKYNHTAKKVEIEKLCENIKNIAVNKQIRIIQEDKMKCELEKFGMKNNTDYEKDVLTREQHEKIKKLRDNKDIVIRKADKSNIFVIINKEDYSKSLEELISDRSKFVKLTEDPTENIKKKINKIIEKLEGDLKLKKLIGQFQVGYLYGNPKLHKSLSNPKYRPIISQIGTPTYNIAKQLNSIIKPYMPNNFMVDSTYEFLQILRTKKINKGMIASFDAESLFTNVPINETINIIIKQTYKNATLPPPKMPEKALRQLLKICTTEAPFKNINGDIYKQIDGVSMGSPLGPTFANFYMGYLENNVLLTYANLKPSIYVRYVDDIFILGKNYNTIVSLKEKLEAHSVLKFTIEIEKHKKLTFLDTEVEKNLNLIKTKVHVKSTNNGDCLNYYSICPERYKISVIKGMLYRGYHISSDWNIFHEEIERIKQTLTNNNFPMNLIDNTINKFMKTINDKHRQANDNSGKNVSFYYKSQMTSNYKIEEKQLNSIFSTHVKGFTDDVKVKLNIYYKNKKLKDILIKNKLCSENYLKKDEHHVIYQYTCDRLGCNSNEKYIGLTTCSLYTRLGNHTQQGSIKEHLQNKHEIVSLKRMELLNSVTILAKNRNVRDLRFLEAILIKDRKPTLNSKEEGSDKLLKIFKH